MLCLLLAEVDVTEVVSCWHVIEESLHEFGSHLGVESVAVLAVDNENDTALQYVVTTQALVDGSVLIYAGYAGFCRLF